MAVQVSKSVVRTNKQLSHSRLRETFSSVELVVVKISYHCKAVIQKLTYGPVQAITLAMKKKMICSVKE
ncbi:hypothetical protein [Desertivirga arenae]|uniref:hypothetical protein n=1 Tax=Desertivirga arenae TaxID=2810309 RepID=UPI001A9796FD|nr:hypothetical protein [Pedobacter sp. SYSU D00823]